MAPPKIAIKPATLLSSTTHQVPGKLLVTELFFSVPLDHANPDTSETLRIFCRCTEKFENPVGGRSAKPKDAEQQLPFLVYIQGGPGFGSPPPQDFPVTKEVLDRGYKFISFDHRGMGLSTTATAATVTAKGSPQKQLDYLQYFRADSAVRDLEAIRLCLTADYPEDKRKWSIMGQSYGGYASVTYLSLYPEGLKESFIFGGLPPLKQKMPDDAIRSLFRRVAGRNEKYYEKYAEDKLRVRRLVQFIEEKKPVLPSGIPLTVSRFLQLGIMFGFHGGFDTVHNAVLRANNDLDMFGFLTRPTLSALEGFPNFDDHVLYALVHGPLYAQGTKSNWVFDRVISEHEFSSDFAHRLEKSEDRDGAKQYFTGEMVFKSVFDDHIELHNLRDAAELLEQKTDWPSLYNVDQLSKNNVPVYAAVFVDDMYVDFGFSSDTAKTIQGCKTFVTNVMYHDAVRSKTAEVLKGVFDLRDDTID
ncbi:hypothetical protein LTR84_008165 [Exophiala bonariae]|uniref:AB hydrolase-1 domain-containing protein n=1 Tax=Exophiala bonariae TaxID=1690606 RepID=A0AAV9MY08_9EURO|nr:hypothetical protein LTR84_008165 [Exophiala bonariae]